MGESAISDRKRSSHHRHDITILPRHYHLDDSTPAQINRGSFPAVDTRTGSTVFIKIMDQADAAKREAALLGAIVHPGVVRARGWGATDAGAYVVLDRVPGDDLENRLRRSRKPMDPIAVVQLMDQLAKSVAAIHAAGILHRDLKPSNIVIQPDGSPVIVDFGAATPMVAPQAAPSAESHLNHLTHGYAALEQYALDAAEGPWTDIHALGAIAFRALTGTSLPSAPQRLAGQASPPNLPTEIRQQAPALAGAIDWALCLDPKERPANVEVWRRALMASEMMNPDAVADRSQDDDDVMPTLPVQRMAIGDPSSIARHSSPGKDPPFDPPPVMPYPGPGGSGPRRWSRTALAGGLSLAALAALVWFGWPFYERHFKSEWIVDAAGNGDVREIGEAMRRAGPDARIVVRAGTYPENLVVDHPFNISAADASALPVLAPTSLPCLVVDAAGSQISGFDIHAPARATIAAVPAAEAATPPSASPATPTLPAPPVAPVSDSRETSCVVLAASDLSFINSRIEGGAAPAVFISGEGTQTIQGTTVIKPTGAGFVITSGAHPRLKGCSVEDAAGPAVIVRGGADAEITDMTIEDSGSVIFAEGSGGRFQGGRIIGSRTSAIQVATGAEPVVTGTTIENAGEAGVFFFDGGRGTVQDSTITGSKLSGIVVIGGSPHIVGNRIEKSGEHGIVIAKAEGAIVDGNRIVDNHGNGLILGAGANVTVGANTLEGNATPQQVDGRRR